ncbi:hypothetical protein [Hoyosella altamirensis]|uniref:Uncharacterized protein n=1 Tax=Hoyosella altamirensis TaxID=616997 RepID=A0A839RRQ1_9ACTN|nr:hypothetical protein [Hoyosella altamirensis]MBB3039027.1 hypothetical protein [Hoyosella altamirensis]
MDCVEIRAGRHRYGGVVDAIARWWDGVELWIAGLPFVPQVVLVVAVMVPLCFVFATVLDRVMGPLFERLERTRRASGARGSETEGEVGGDAEV